MRSTIDLVWTGDEILGASGRDTRVVVQELFRTAQRSVLISTYVLDRGENAATLFGGLAAKHDRNIEAGVMLRDKSAAKALSDRFETLAARQILQQLSIE